METTNNELKSGVPETTEKEDNKTTPENKENQKEVTATPVSENGHENPPEAVAKESEVAKKSVETKQESESSQSLQSKEDLPSETAENEPVKPDKKPTDTASAPDKNTDNADEAATEPAAVNTDKIVANKELVEEKDEIQEGKSNDAKEIETPKKSRLSADTVTDATEKEEEIEDKSPEEISMKKADPVTVEQKEDAAENTKEEEMVPETSMKEPGEETADEIVEETDKQEIKVEKGQETPQDEQPDDDENEEDDGDDGDEDDGSESETDLNQLSRQELVEMLEQTLKEGEVEAIKRKVGLIKVAFLKLNNEEQEKRFESYINDGGEEDAFEVEKDDIEIRFNAAFSIYKEKKAKWIEEQEALKQKNLETKKLILEELKALIESEESLKTTYDEFKNLQDKWKEAGMVPKAEVNNLWQSYHFFVEKFFDKVKINKELRDLDLKKNLETKIELCEAAEELLLETSILKSFKKLQDLHHQWKETGPVPADKKDEIWDRFKDATDKINQRRRDHYNKLKEDQKNNLTAKIALCEQAEELLQIENETIKDWQANTEKISELLKMWKTIGPAPRAQNDEIWERFKSSLDGFFAAKKEFFQTIKDEQQNNYNLKLNLCAQAEALKTSTDWRKTTQDLINLQKEWKNIGPVPKRHSDKIWKRFRAACDEFFNSKAEFFSNIKEHEADNLKKKEELIRLVENHTYDTDRNKNLEVLKDFQRQWMDIGHVPFKDKDRVQVAFRNAINEQLDKLNINKAAMRTVNYKDRIENLKDKPNANRIINNERNFLIGKRKQLEDDIKLWENNMGFLASSKKADLLKEEFEKKIEKVKAEIEILTEKIKFLERETD